MKKLYATDFDKTFYINENDLKINMKLVSKFRDKGNIFSIITGRGAESFDVVKKQFDLKYDYLALDHGAIILDKDDNLIKTYFIDKSIIDELIIDLELEKSTINYFCNTNRVVDSNNKCLTKICVKYNESDTERIYNKIKFKYSCVNIYKISDVCIEIISKETNKLNSVKIISELENISRENVVVSGDGESDIDMIKYYNGYKMIDSVEDLRKINVKCVESVSSILEELI